MVVFDKSSGGDGFLGGVQRAVCSVMFFSNSFDRTIHFITNCAEFDLL
jgi:hypothetical protein